MHVNIFYFYKKKEMENVDSPYEDFVNKINFIYPKGLTPENECKSYRNLRDREPTEKKNKSSSTSGLESSSPEAFSDNKYKGNKPEKSSSINEDKKKFENLRFGQHENFSFFESYAREIIFQIFDYHPMYFFGYTVKYDESSGEVIEIKGEKNKKEYKQEDKKDESK